MNAALLALTCLILMQDAGTGTSSNKAELLEKINNPVSGIINLPLESNFEVGPAPDHAFSYTMNLQPVLPFSIGKEWLVVTRTVMPIIARDVPADASHGRFGLGDTTLTFFFSPKHVSNGLTWGAGPELLLPTATDREFGNRKWGAGPSFVVLKQQHGWTNGLLVDHLWSFAGTGPSAVSSTLIEPFVIHSWENGFGIKFETEARYDWKAPQWTVPLEAGVSQLVAVGKRSINLGGDFLYYAARGPNDPRWGIRFTSTFAFTK
jgi:hypothetical protein